MNALKRGEKGWRAEPVIMPSKPALICLTCDKALCATDPRGCPGHAVDMTKTIEETYSQ